MEKIFKNIMTYVVRFSVLEWVRSFGMPCVGGMGPKNVQEA